MFNKAVFLDVDSMGSGLDLSCLNEYARQWDMHQVTSAGQTLERVRQAELVATNKVVLNREILEACDNLKLICVAATGTNNVDLQAAHELGIAVTNVTAYGTPSVAQHVFTLILALTNRLNEYVASVKTGQWAKAPYFCVLDYPFRELNGKTLGIVGMGELGRGVAKVADAFGMEVIISQRPGGEATAGRLPFNEILKRSDVLSLHVPLADNTRNLIAAPQLALMKKNAILINAARGGIVDEAALADALVKGEIGGAGFDVLTVEPPREGNVLLELDLPNLIITPHVAWAATESRQRLINLLALNIKAFFDEEKLNRVD